MNRRQTRAAALLGALLVIDYLPAPAAIFTLDHPVVYDALRMRGEPGALCELPFGLRDGFGETGRFDMRDLYYQTLHGRPIAGGFVARLPPSVRDEYRSDPVLGLLLRLSAGEPLADERSPPPADAARRLKDRGFGFVVLNRALAPRDLQSYVADLPLLELASDGTRVLYAIDPAGGQAGSPPGRAPAR